MNSLESVRGILQTYLAETNTYDDLFKILLIVNRKDFYQKIYDAFFSLIASIELTPEDIVHQLQTYISGLDGFSSNRPIQTFIAFTCFESLAKRNIKALTGSWEELSWIIIKYSSMSTHKNMNTSLLFEISSPMSVQTIHKFISPTFCLNPCLRLEFYRAMRIFYRSLFPDLESFRENVLLTLLEVCDNYKTLTVNQILHFRSFNLKSLIKDNNISIEYINYDDDFNMNRKEVISAVLKLTKLFTLLVKETSEEHEDQDTYKQLYSCLTFCGLVPMKPSWDINYEIIEFVETVSDYPFLMNYVIDTLETITEVSTCFPQEEELQEKVSEMKSRILHIFYKKHIKEVPKHQYLQEINGGNTSALEYHLRYIQNNILEDDHYSDYSDYEENDY